ncbi:MAG: DNA adenine methylase [Candidatus Velthaea sp.]
MSLVDTPTTRLHQVDFVSTRFHGSKRKLLDWIWSNTRDLLFDSVLDLFGGTGAVSHMFKAAGKSVTYNDFMRFNWYIGRALVENSSVSLTREDVDTVLTRHSDVTYPSFISETFGGIYFTDVENAWLDQTVHNITTLLVDDHKRAVAFFALFQACTIKRPYNLFHRSNLYMRTANVTRSFGNHTTWNKPFPLFFRQFVGEANAAIFDNGRQNRAINMDALEAPRDYDLVYIDSPYVSNTKTATDYFAFYQFLEGLADYFDWPNRVDESSKHRAIPSPRSPWTRPKEITGAFKAVFDRYRTSTLVVSYRDDGIPTVEELCEMLASVGKNTRIFRLPQKYVLSNKDTHEVLVIAT